MSTLTARSAPRTILGLLAALGLVAALTMPAFGADTWATVTGHAEGTAENNHAATWGENCDDVATPEGGWGETYVLPELGEGLVYSLVIVKAGAEASVPGFVNTLFANPSAGETVFADSDGSFDYSDGDKNISHIIYCTEEEAEESQAEESEPAESIREDTQGGNPTPTGGTLPDTAVGQFGQIPATVLSLVLMGALAATVYVRLARQR